MDSRPNSRALGADADIVCPWCGGDGCAPCADAGVFWSEDELRFAHAEAAIAGGIALLSALLEGARTTPAAPKGAR